MEDGYRLLSNLINSTLHCRKISRPKCTNQSAMHIESVLLHKCYGFRQPFRLVLWSPAHCNVLLDRSLPAPLLHLRSPPLRPAARQPTSRRTHALINCDPVKTHKEATKLQVVELNSSRAELEVLHHRLCGEKCRAVARRGGRGGRHSHGTTWPWLRSF